MSRRASMANELEGLEQALASETESFKATKQLLPEEVCGNLTNHGLAPGPDGIGMGKINQDRGLVAYPLAGDDQQGLFCVFDGHGKHGEKVSEFAANTTLELLEADNAALRKAPAARLRKVLLKVDALLKKNDEINAELSGTTAVVAYLKGSTLWVANIGDSRAVLATDIGLGEWATEALTKDQTAGDPEEQERIEMAGGYVSSGSHMFGPSRVWTDRTCQKPGLAVSRSIGDFVGGSVGVCAEAVVTERKLTAADRALIVASDGVWEFVSNVEAVRTVERHSDDATAAAVALINTAGERWHREEADNRDDITAVVLTLQPMSLPPPEEAAGEPSPSFLQRQVKTDSELGVAPPAAARRPSFVQRRLSMFAVGRRSSESRTAPDPEGGRRSSSDWTPPVRTAKMEGTVEMAVEDA